jgi:hypothetical protein
VQACNQSQPASTNKPASFVFCPSISTSSGHKACETDDRCIRMSLTATTHELLALHCAAYALHPELLPGKCCSPVRRVDEPLALSRAPMALCQGWSSLPKADQTVEKRAKHTCVCIRLGGAGYPIEPHLQSPALITHLCMLCRPRTLPARWDLGLKLILWLASTAAHILVPEFSWAAHDSDNMLLVQAY